MLNDILVDKICSFYFIMAISEKLFFSFQMYSNDDESLAFSKSGSVKWAHKRYFEAFF